jgi:hypothetical protein
MRWIPTHDDATPDGAAEHSEAARREPTGTLVLIARAAAHDRISAALRDARARAGMSEQEVVDLLRDRGVSITAATLDRWERTGGIRLENAVDLAAVYDMSLDDLAGRRSGHGRILGTLERALPEAA